MIYRELRARHPEVVHNGLANGAERKKVAADAIIEEEEEEVFAAQKNKGLGTPVCLT